MSCCFVDCDIPIGFNLIWMDGLIIAAFETLDTEHEHSTALRSIEKTCENKGWYFLQTEELIGFDPTKNESHQFQIIWVRELPLFDQLRVYSNHVSDVLF